PGARLYKSGDLARYRADGSIDFLGRLDQQVKIRGVRVEPAEVEAILRRTPGLRDVVVVVRNDQPDDRHLVAYLVADQDLQLDERALRSDLRAHLPEQMVPAAFVRLEALPLS